MAFGQIDVGEHITVTTYTDDDASIVDATAVLNAGTDSWKVGQNGKRLRIQENGATPATITALAIKIYAATGHSPGNMAMYAYTDDNSITATGAIIVDFSVGSSPWTFTADATFLAQLGAVTGGGIAVRISDAADNNNEATVSQAEIEYTATSAAEIDEVQTVLLANISEVSGTAIANIAEVMTKTTS
jgi:hypothetical protein